MTASRRVALPLLAALALFATGCENASPGSVRRATCGAVRLACTAAESLICSSGGEVSEPAAALSGEP